MIRSTQRCDEGSDMHNDLTFTLQLVVELGRLKLAVTLTEAVHISTQALGRGGQSGGSRGGGRRGGGRAGRSRMTKLDPINEEGDDSGAEESWLGTDWVLFDDGGRTPRCTSSAGAGPSHSAGHEGDWTGISMQNVLIGENLGGCAFVCASVWFAIGRHYFYVYYDEEQYFHDLHGLSYRGESVKKKFIELKCGTHLRKMHRKIMEALGGVEAPHLLLLDVQPSFADATPLPYNNQPCSAIDDVDETEVLGATHTHDMGGSSHTYEHVQADMDRGIDIDTSRDVYKEFIDIDGLVDDAEVLDVPLIENNEKDCPTTVPIPEWFTSNTWDNIKDPSPALGTGHLTSWHKGEHPAIGMLFKSKASVQYVLTLSSV
nr:hypothetical protein CFP56_08241 [Quercus suber]